MQLPVIPTGVAALRRAVTVSVLLHVAVALVAWKAFDPTKQVETELVDIEVAPPPPKAEALPAEVARLQEQEAALREEAARASEPNAPTEGSVDAGTDAPIDAPPDAPTDAPTDAPRRRRPDAGIDAAPDAAETMIAASDAGTDGDGDGGIDATRLAHSGDLVPGDAGAGDTTAAGLAGSGAGSGSGSGAGSGSGEGSGSIASAAGSGSGVPGATDEPAVDGAPTTAGTAANLLTYFPAGHIVTALIRFDRLRGTEWSAQTERLLRPMPDYQVLFGPSDARIADKLDTLVISSPRPRDATATTLVAHTSLGRSALRDFLAATAPVTWSTAKGGLLGKRTGRGFPGDKRVFLSPFKGWFLLAQPADLGSLTAAAPGDLDAIEARAKLPAWLASVRAIEAESGDKRGPALVLTVALAGARFDLKGNDFGLGIQTVPTPDRISLAMELVKQGWLVRGNLRFAKEADAIEFVTAAQSVQQRVADSHAIQLVVGKQVMRIVANLSFARTGGRVSYATSISIADSRSLMKMMAQQLDQYYGSPP